MPFGHAFSIYEYAPSGTISAVQDWSLKFESIVNHYEYVPSMRKEQQDENKTKEMRIIQDNGIWKVINHKGRTLDATRTRVEAEESMAILEHFPEYGGRWP